MKKCTKCGKCYPATAEHFDKCRYGEKVYLRNVCKGCRNKRRRELNQEKKNALEALQSTGTTTVNSFLEIELLNDVNSEFKLITHYKDLAEKVMQTMRKDKLSKYSSKTQDFCVEIMTNLNKFLTQQLDNRRIIDVTNS